MDKPSYLFDKALVLRQIPLFAELNVFERRLIFDSLGVAEFRSSERIYRQGDPPDAFYCIVTGRVEIFIEKEGREETLEVLHRGKYFGFISLLTGEPHSVSARAVNDTVVVKIPKENFGVLLKAVPRLAIDLSRMLSRRLKRRDLHPKSVFESTIVSVYGEEEVREQVALYALNLALGVRNQTQKKVVVVDAVPGDSKICRVLGLDGACSYSVKERFFNPEEVLKKIIRHDRGVDVLRIDFSPENPHSTPFLIGLLTMLVNDYHYCLLPLDPGLGKEAFRIMSQSDAIHLIVPPEPESLKKMSLALQQSGIGQEAELKKKVKLIVLEEGSLHGRGAKLFREEEAALLLAPIFATLPAPQTQDLLIREDFSDPYSKTIRRISRSVGEVLMGLVLGSGSAMGLAHIGVLKVLEKEDIPIDIVCGSSMGAVIAAFWCAGYPAGEIERIILENKDKRYLFGLDDFVFPLHGLIRGKHIHRFLEKYLADRTFYDLKRPLKIVVCDCQSMRQVVFDSGSLIDAVMASVSIPGVFHPYRIADHYYVDGGILNPLPCDVLVESGVKKIISVNVLPSAEEIERTYELASKRAPARPLLKPNIFDVIVSSVQSMEYLLAELSSVSSSDVTLHPDMTAVSWAAFENAGDLIKRGEEEARLHLQEIKDLAALA